MRLKPYLKMKSVAIDKKLDKNELLLKFSSQDDPGILSTHATVPADIWKY